MIEITKKKFALFMFLAWFVGVACIATTQPEARTITKVETKEVVKNEAEWRELKNLDDSIFSVASDGFGTCSRMITATSNGDMTALAKETDNMDDSTSALISKANARKILLEKLGY